MIAARAPDTVGVMAAAATDRRVDPADIRAAERAIGEAVEAWRDLERLARAAAEPERVTMRAMQPRTLHFLVLLALASACGDDAPPTDLEPCACGDGEQVACSAEREGCFCYDTDTGAAGASCESELSACAFYCASEARELCDGATFFDCLLECGQAEAAQAWCPA